MSLLIATAGAFGATAIGLPLPWLTGALVACLVFRRAQIAPPMASAAQVLLGVLVGLSMDPQRLAFLPHTWLSVAVVPVFVGLTMLVGGKLLRGSQSLSGLDSRLAAAPGGLTIISAIWADRGRSARVPLISALRLMIVFAVVVTASRALAAPAPQVAPPSGSWLLLFGAGIGGWGLSKLVRIPGGALLFPMATTLVMSALGPVHALPRPVVCAAQIAFGVSLAARCGVITRKDLGQVLHGGTLIAIFQVALAALCAWASQLAIGAPLTGITAFLAFVPGNIYQVSLLAMTFGANVEVVLVHHLIRTFAIAAFASWFASDEIAAERVPRLATNT